MRNYFPELVQTISCIRIWCSVEASCNLQRNHEKNFARTSNEQAKRGEAAAITDDTSVSVYASSAVHSAIAVGLLNANIIGLSLILAMALITSGVKSRPAPATPVINKGENSNFNADKIKQFLSTAFL